MFMFVDMSINEHVINDDKWGRSLILHRPHRPTGHTGASRRDLILHQQPVMYQITLFTRHYCVISSAAGGAQAHVRRCLATRTSRVNQTL